MEVLLAREATNVATVLRRFRSLYPLIGAGQILAVANAVLARRRRLLRRSIAPFAAVSLCLWLTVLGLGWLIGYKL